MNPDPSEPVVQRQVAVGPVVAAVVGLLIFAVIVTVVITLAAASPPPSVMSTPVAQDSSSAAPQQTSAPTPESTLIPPRAQTTANECRDYTAEVESLDIESARVEQSDRDVIVAEITFTAPLERDTTELGIYAERSDGDRSYQFSVEIDDGEVDDVTAYEIERDDSDGLESDDAEIAGNTVRFVVPRSIGKKLGDEWSWFAFSAVDGATVDTCPGTPSAPEYQRFER